MKKKRVVGNFYAKKVTKFQNLDSVTNNADEIVSSFNANRRLTFARRLSDFRNAGSGCSLSPRERVMVRGNASPRLLVASIAEMKKLITFTTLFISAAAVSVAAEISSPNTNLTVLEEQIVAAAKKTVRVVK